MAVNFTASDLYNKIFPSGENEGISVGFALNKCMVSGETKLSDGDELAFIPPVGGG